MGWFRGLLFPVPCSLFPVPCSLFPKTRDSVPDQIENRYTRAWHLLPTIPTSN
ncbi:MAG: hypothetical protein F6K50_44010 [Moorea sp. SIO3I7]|nr:hypothetical protein [Moorena sp. SIO3I7]